MLHHDHVLHTYTVIYTQYTYVANLTIMMIHTVTDVLHNVICILHHLLIYSTSILHPAYSQKLIFILWISVYKNIAQAMLLHAWSCCLYHSGVLVYLFIMLSW